MTNNSIDIILKEVMNTEGDIIKQLQLFNKLNELIADTDSVYYESNLRKILCTIFEGNNVDVLLSALNVTHTCLLKGLFMSTDNIALIQAILKIGTNASVDNVENQQLWLKAFSVFELMDSLHVQLFSSDPTKVLNILTKVITSVSNSIQKASALNIFYNMISKITLENHEDQIFELWISYICPLMFNLNNDYIQKVALSISDKLLPFIQRMFQKKNEYYDIICEDISQRYTSVLRTLIENANLIFTKLWLFLVKCVGFVHYNGNPFINILLAVIENAFRSNNLSVRKQAFICWQGLIEIFALHPTEKFTEKRIRLIEVPLTRYSVRMEQVIEVKLETWCKLINLMEQTNHTFENEVIVNFLHFCFGVFIVVPLASYSDSYNGFQHAKKYPHMHLPCCQAFLQIFGNRDYINKEIEEKLTFFNFKKPIVTQKIFNRHYSEFINAVGEACVLLCTIEDHSSEVDAINDALWKTLFNFIQLVEIEHIENKLFKQLSNMILALANLAHPKGDIISKGIVPIFNIITSNIFTFFNINKFTTLLFLPLCKCYIKNDAIPMKSDLFYVITRVLTFKLWDSDFEELVHSIIEIISPYFQDKFNVMIAMKSLNVWNCLCENFLMLVEENAEKLKDMDSNLALFIDFFSCPLHTLSKNINPNDFTQDWKKLYTLYSSKADSELANKLAISLVKTIHLLISEGSTSCEIAEIVFVIFGKINFNAKDISNISNMYLCLKQILKLDIVPIESFSILATSLNGIFLKGITLENFYLFIDSVLDCTEVIFQNNKHKKSDLLPDIANFVKEVKYSTKLTTAFERIYKIISDLEIVSQLKEAILLQCSKYIHKPGNKNEIKIKTLNSKSDDNNSKINTIFSKNALNEKILENDIEDIPILTLIEIKKKKSETLNPVDEDTVFINEPYNFDPKKLTEHQKEKLAKRADDIPALYEDLSRSQTQTFDSTPDVTNDTLTLNDTNEGDNQLNSESTLTNSTSSVQSRPRGRPRKNKLITRDDFPEEIQQLQIQEGTKSKVETNPRHHLRRRSLQLLKNSDNHNKLSPKEKSEENNLLLTNKRESRELRRIKRNAKNSEIIMRKKRVTRNLSISYEEKESPNISPIKSNSQNEEIIDSSQNTDIKQCKIPALYGFSNAKPGEQIVVETATTKMDVIKGPNSTSPFTIFGKNVNNVNDNSSVRKKILFDDEMEVTNDEPMANALSGIETETINTEVLNDIADIPKTTDDKQDKNNQTVSRKVLFDETSEEGHNLVLTNNESSSERNEVNCDKIITSPVSKETPTRNTEFLKNTREISPIRHLTKNQEKNNENTTETIDSSSSVELDAIRKDSPHPIKFKKNKSKFHGCRSAQMMDLISVISNVNVNSSKKKEDTPKNAETAISASKNRIKKIMGQFEKPDFALREVEEEGDNYIRQEDFLQFSKEVPSACASPSASILKRKMSETDMESPSRPTKRRKVHFMDPPVSCEKFFEKDIKSRKNDTHRITRSVSKEKNKSENFSNEIIEELEKISAGFNFEENADLLVDNGNSMIEEIFDDTQPIKPELLDCKDAVDRLQLSEVTNRKLIKKNIKTIGDLAALTEKQVNEIFNNVDFVKTVLNTHFSFFSSPTKRIKPITLSSLKDSPLSQTKKFSESPSKTNANNSKTVSESLFTKSSTKENELPQCPRIILENVETAETLINDKTILNEEINDEKIDTIFQSIIDIIKQKNYNPKPLLNKLATMIPNSENLIPEDAITNKEDKSTIIDVKNIEKVVKQLNETETDNFMNNLYHLVSKKIYMKPFLNNISGQNDTEKNDIFDMSVSNFLDMVNDDKLSEDIQAMLFKLLTKNLNPHKLIKLTSSVIEAKFDEVLQNSNQ